MMSSAFTLTHFIKESLLVGTFPSVLSPSQPRRGVVSAAAFCVFKSVRSLCSYAEDSPRDPDLPDARSRRQSRDVTLIAICLVQRYPKQGKVSAQTPAALWLLPATHRVVLCVVCCRCRPQQTGWGLRGARAEKKHTKR